MESKYRSDYIIDDRRVYKERPLGYLVCNDKFLSGCGMAPNRSLYALSFFTGDQADALMIAAKHRSEMVRPRLLYQVKDNGQPDIRLLNGDHLAIVDEETAAEWYKGAACRWAQTQAG